MEQKLDLLAEKVEQVSALVERLRAEKAALTARLLAAESGQASLRQSVETARSRIEALMRQLPEGKA
jgi:chromosome segregation ATPase